MARGHPTINTYQFPQTLQKKKNFCGDPWPEVTQLLIPISANMASSNRSIMKFGGIRTEYYGFVGLKKYILFQLFYYFIIIFIF